MRRSCTGARERDALPTRWTGTLPQFEADGRHAATPAELQVASCADEMLDRQLLAQKARDVIARLPDLYREAFVLRDLEELSTAQVAQGARHRVVDGAATRASRQAHAARLSQRTRGRKAMNLSHANPASTC
jgi:DNA-directed RNA polymerase specialized sigma24 family protein